MMFPCRRMCEIDHKKTDIPQMFVEMVSEHMQQLITNQRSP